MTAEEERDIEVAKAYEDMYNNDIERFVFEVYTPDCEVNGGFIHGHEKFIQIERDVLQAAPKRKMRVDRRHVTGNVVVVEAVLLDSDQGDDWKLPFCAVLTCRDGKIATDWTYAEFSKWPGIQIQPCGVG